MSIAIAAASKGIPANRSLPRARLRVGMAVAALAVLGGCGGQPAAGSGDPGGICATVLCRQPGPFEMTKDDGTTYAMRIRETGPFVHDGQVSVLANETVYVEAEIRNGRLVDLTAVPSIRRPEKTLVFTLSQEPGRPEMVLQLTNPFPRPVKYHAAMMLPGRDGLQQTSSCPVLGGGRTAFEMWPHAIFQLLLFDFRLLDPDAERMICEF